jgi:hypothetical protein
MWRADSFQHGIFGDVIKRWFELEEPLGDILNLYFTFLRAYGNFQRRNWSPLADDGCQRG